MDSHELLLYAANTMAKLKVRYLIAGSMATMTYGEARFTNNVDIVADLQLHHVPELLIAFPNPEYYVSEPAVQDAIQRKFQFNGIHPTSGLKIGFMIPTADPFNESRLGRGNRVELDDAGNSTQFASAEDAILKKLVYFRDGGADKHLRDIRGVLLVQGDAIDVKYIQHWAEYLNVTQQWQQVLSE